MRPPTGRSLHRPAARPARLERSPRCRRLPRPPPPAAAGRAPGSRPPRAMRSTRAASAAGARRSDSPWRGHGIEPCRVEIGEPRKPTASSVGATTAAPRNERRRACRRCSPAGSAGAGRTCAVRSAAPKWPSDPFGHRQHGFAVQADPFGRAGGSRSEGDLGGGRGNFPGRHRPAARPPARWGGGAGGGPWAPSAPAASIVVVLRLAEEMGDRDVDRCRSQRPHQGRPRSSRPLSSLVASTCTSRAQPAGGRRPDRSSRHRLRRGVAAPATTVAWRAVAQAGKNSSTFMRIAVRRVNRRSAAGRCPAMTIGSWSK